MRGIKILVLVLLGVAGLALGTGAATGQNNPAAKRTPVVHVRHLVVNGQAVDHARVPARVNRLLRSVTESPAFSCPGATTQVNNASAQTCRWPTGYTKLVTCIQTSTSATVTQTCDASQANTTQANRAVIIQIIWSQNPASPQDGKQLVRLRQTNGTGTNWAGVSQYIKQSLGRGTPDDTEDADAETLTPTTSPTQIQNSHQTIHLWQITDGTNAGDNNAALLQFLRQRARASNVGTLNQQQNLGLNTGPTICQQDMPDDPLLAPVQMDPDANQCIISLQHSSAGHNNLGANQDYNQLQRVRKATGGFQTQGVDNEGGLDIGLVQLSDGQSNILTNQNERLVQRALDAAAVFQDQNGPRKGRGSSQDANPANVWKGFQTSTLIQTSHPTTLSFTTIPTTTGHQSDLLEYFGTTSGDVRATQTSSINGDVTNWGCPPPGLPTEGQNNTCEAFVKCEAGEIGEGLRFQAVSSACTPTCPEGTFFNPDTGQCEVVCGEGCTTIETPTASTPVYAYKR